VKLGLVSLLLAALSLGGFGASANCTTPIKEEQPTSIFEQVDDGSWTRVSRPSGELGGDVITVARVYDSKEGARVTISTSVAGDIWDFAVYCFDRQKAIKALRFEATTAWGWSYSRSIDYQRGNKKADVERFFHTETKQPLKKDEQETWIREHVHEYSALGQLPFLKSNSRKTKTRTSKSST
jgi:hypothetical protein